MWFFCKTDLPGRAEATSIAGAQPYFINQYQLREYQLDKKLLVAATIAAVAVSPASFADSVVYGKLHTSLDYNDYDKDKNWSVESRASRLGFKGSEDLGSGLKAIYQIEFGISSDGGDQQQSSTGTKRRTPVNNHRNTFIGLTSDWGTGLVGRHDTPMKMAWYAQGNEILGDSIIDLNLGSSIIGVMQEVRANNALTYVSPNFSGFTFAGAIIPGEELDVGVFTPPTPYTPVGSKAAKDGLADHYSLGAMYSGNGLKASVGYEFLDNQVIGIAAGAPNNSMKTWQAGASYTMNSFLFGAGYQNTKNFGFVDKNDYDAWTLSGKYSFGNNAVGAVYTHSDLDPNVLGKTKTDGWGLSGEHNFSKRSKVYAAYAWNKTKPDVVSDFTDQQFSLGMIHNF
jgi:predicted porin